MSEMLPPGVLYCRLACGSIDGFVMTTFISSAWDRELYAPIYNRKKREERKIDKGVH